MPVTKVFQSGNSQAVRLPKEFRFQDDEVVIKRIGDTVLLLPVRYAAEALKDDLDQLEPEFQVARNQPVEAEERDFDN